MSRAAALRAAAAPLLAAALLLLPRSAAAFSVGTGFSDWCHERITVDAYDDEFWRFPRERIPLPDDEVWRDLADALDDRFGLPAEEPEYRFVFLSLVIGVRHPDTEGHSIANPGALRTAHASPESQYPHALRAPADDGPAGDLSALAGARAALEAELEQARAALALPAADQIRPATIYLEFYGWVDVPVWAPAWHVGVALHVLQDSYTHTLRSADLRTVLHVLNYADAIAGGLDEARDGLPHSKAMDRCTGDAAPLAEAATAASIDFLIAVREELGFGRGGVIAAVLDERLAWQPGCDAGNAYCGTPWLTLARREPTRPYLEEALGCSAAPFALPIGAGGPANGRAALLPLLLGGAALLAARGRAAARRRRYWMPSSSTSKTSMPAGAPGRVGLSP